jgi:hypothetical protein
MMNTDKTHNLTLPGVESAKTQCPSTSYYWYFFFFAGGMPGQVELAR